MRSTCGAVCAISSLSSALSADSRAIISLLVAPTALGCNTWRNEQTELNRNIRRAGFETMVNIGELQRVTYLANYDAAVERIDASIDEPRMAVVAPLEALD